MSGFAGFELAVAVTQAGGLGQIGFMDTPAMEAQLRQTQKLLESIDTSTVDPEIIPVGVGVIVFGANLTSWWRLLSKYKPAMIWLFAAEDSDDYEMWTAQIRKASPHTRIWVQLGSVQAGLEVAQKCKPDGLVMQGSDAGGHGYEIGASVISLVPEMCDALSAAGLADSISVIAAGGIVDGRGVVATRGLGAEGVVMGTRFLAAPETHLQDDDRALVIATKDGGQATVRTRVFDDLFGANSWPEVYNGRGLANQSYLDRQKGMTMKDIRQRFWTGMRARDGRFSVVWSGTGVGMVNKQEPAAQILEQIHADVEKLTMAMSSQSIEPMRCTSCFR